MGFFFLSFRKNKCPKIPKSSRASNFSFVAKSWISSECKGNIQVTDFIQREKEIPSSWLFPTIGLCWRWRSRATLRTPLIRGWELGHRWNRGHGHRSRAMPVHRHCPAILARSHFVLPACTSPVTLHRRTSKSSCELGTETRPPLVTRAAWASSTWCQDEHCLALLGRDTVRGWGTETPRSAPLPPWPCAHSADPLLGLLLRL